MGWPAKAATGRAWALVLAVAVAGCSPLYRNHGYVPSDEDLEQIVVGVDSRESVADIVGTPTTGGVTGAQGYYYVSQRMRTFAYREPEVIEREIVAISFDEAGMVENIERYGLEDGNVVRLSRRVTASSVQDLSILRQLIGNLGRFNAADILGD